MDFQYQIMDLAGQREKIQGPFVHLETIDSTNAWLKKKKDLLVKEGTVVFADRQTAGRGRMERVWEGGVFQHIFTSIVLHPKLPLGLIPTMTLWVGLAVYRTIKKLKFEDLTIKWPNDILIGSKKVSGILCELKSIKEKKNLVIAGIGLNLNGEVNQYPEEIRNKTTTLSQESGKNYDRNQVLIMILDELDLILRNLETSGIQDLIREWMVSSFSIGKEVRFENQGNIKIARISRLDSNGNLVLSSEKEKDVTLLSGEISFLS